MQLIIFSFSCTIPRGALAPPRPAALYHVARLAGRVV